MTNPANDKHFHEHHEYGEQKDEHGNKSRGYAKKEYEYQEYPKAVRRDDQEKVVHSKAEELAFLEEE